MQYSKPVTEIIRERFSCRRYLDKLIKAEKRQAMESFLSSSQTGPFGARARFELAVATEQDRKALKGLGTYGFIKGATGFIIGAVVKSPKNLEDYGYLMERIILFATDIGLGTCWLGGTFTKSRFAKKISASNAELAPAVTSIGYIGGDPQDNRIRQRAKDARRYSWDTMFFDREFGTPVSREAAGAYATPLKMVRLGPSASNKQPWRIIKDGNTWHFYIQRTKGYREGVSMKLLKVADMQRIDMGIAMSHFELAANEAGLDGEWEILKPAIEKPDELTEYVTSWVG